MSLARSTARAWRLLRREGAVAFGRMAWHQGRRAVARRTSPLPYLRARPPVGALLGATSPEERAWLHHYASRDYTGAGEIVDLGCWLGSSTLALAHGVAANGHLAERAGRIHAFDLFLWESWMDDSVAGTELSGRFRPGESFLPAFEERIAALRELVTLHPGDLQAVGWRPAKPIDLLFNDAAKSWGLANAIVRDFYPHLVPGRSLVVEQDFAHFYTPWVHVVRDRLRDFFEPVHYIPYSGSMLFRLTKALPPEALAMPVSFESFTPDEVERAFETSLALVDRPMRPNVWAARVMWEVHQGRLTEGRRLLAEANPRGFRGLDLEKVRPLLAGSDSSSG